MLVKCLDNSLEISMKFGTHIYHSQSMNQTNFGDHLRFHAAPQACKVFTYPVKYVQLYKLVIFIYFFGADIHVPLRINCFYVGDLSTFRLSSS